MCQKKGWQIKTDIFVPNIFSYFQSIFLIILFINMLKSGLMDLTTNRMAATPQVIPVAKLLLRACCQYINEENCEDFQTPQEMVGIGCCNAKPINVYEEICCEGVMRRRRQSLSDGTFGYAEYCCGNQTLTYSQTCCQGVVHNIPNGECCGPQAYPRSNVDVLCCNGVLNVDPGLTCCGVTPYDGGLRETCCGGSVYLKELFDGCCPLYNSNPPDFRQFNSRTHLCCDEPIERFSNKKCCYLKNSTGQFYPKSYDSSNFCCVFPYTNIAPKNTQGTCNKVVAPPTSLNVVTPSNKNLKQNTNKNQKTISIVNENSINKKTIEDNQRDIIDNDDDNNEQDNEDQSFDQDKNNNNNKEYTNNQSNENQPDMNEININQSENENNMNKNRNDNINDSN